VFEQLDFLYVPSDDVATDADRFCDELGARPVFRIEAFGARVAMVELTDAPPAVLLTDHLEGERAILVYRVGDLDAAVAGLEERGFDPGPPLEIPHGPCRSFTVAGGHRVALYELTRPEVPERFGGRRDF
jgi:hypothetical protein